MDQFTFHQEITIDETEITGSWAFSRGMFVSTLTPKGEGQAVLIDGKFMTVLKRQADGSWKIYRDIWNSNLPAGG
jgi:ketosteroid isomerase-like protein